ncbi:MAG: membrane-associated protein [Gammaproteobacteria bacterium]
MDMIPQWFKIAYTLVVLAFIVIYWQRYGPRNFLWFSDVAFIGAVPAMWLESALISGVLACMALLPEVFWNVDYGLRLLLRRRITGLTEYMFDPGIPRWLRGVSLFHVPLPLVLVWLVAAYGYPEVSLAVTAGTAAVVLALSYLLSSREKNINWVFGLGRFKHRLPAPVYLGLLYLGMVFLGFLPTHWLLLRLFQG